MTRKDYELIAAHLNTGHPNRSTEVNRWQDLGYTEAILRVARAFAADNPRFDEAKFLKAAGVPV